jgi:hypothetical protein
LRAEANEIVAVKIQKGKQDEVGLVAYFAIRLKKNNWIERDERNDVSFF